MTLVDCQMEGFSLRLSAHFTALEGTRTFACIFENVFIPDDMIIDHDGAAFLRRSRAGIVNVNRTLTSYKPSQDRETGTPSPDHCRVHDIQQQDERQTRWR